MRTGLLITAGWVAAATAATIVSWSAVSVVRSAVVPHRPASRQGEDEASSTGNRPLGGAAIRPLPVSSSAAGPTGVHSHSGSTRDQATHRITGLGGSVTFHCAQDLPVYLNVTPHAGFVSRSDGTESNEIRFESGSHRTEIVITCIGDVPRWSVNETDSGNAGTGGGGTPSPVVTSPAAPPPSSAAATSPAGDNGGGGNGGGGPGHGGHGGDSGKGGG